MEKAGLKFGYSGNLLELEKSTLIPKNTILNPKYSENVHSHHLVTYAFIATVEKRF